MLTSLRLLTLTMLIIFVVTGCTDSNSDNSTNQNNNNNNNNNTDDPDNSPGNEAVTIVPKDILTSATYKNLVFQFAICPGTSIARKSLDNFSGFMNSRINKEKILSRIDSVPSIGKASVTVDDLKAFEKSYRKKTTDGDTLFIWVPVVDAEYSPDPTPNIIFGAAYGSSSFSIFGKKLNEYTLPDMVSRFTLETFVFEHEFCHLLGLTNGGTNMVTAHQDADHGHHCSNTNCLMYWRADQSVKLTDILDNSGNSDLIPILDANCIADLQAAGGK